MTDESQTPKTPEDQTPAPEGAPPEGTPTPEDQAPPVAGEPPAQPPPQQDPNILGALTPQENAVLTSLRRKTQQLTLELGRLDLQKDDIRGQIRSNDDQSQGVLVQIGQRLGIPEGIAWTVGADGNARAIPPHLLQAMQGGMPQMAPQPRPQPPAATVSQPEPEPEGGGEPKEE